MHVLLTGHTGFKGSWLTLLLTELGHRVSGVALDPESVSLFSLARVSARMSHDMRADIRSPLTVTEALAVTKPDFLIHMAAQPLVRESFEDPRLTMETNVMGTLNVLEASGTSDTLQGVLVVTTDKVYRNRGRVAGYVEDEPLGGDDPYSASKAMADLLTHSWVSSFPGPPTAVVRAGNVIGGGDYSKDRLIPDTISALSEGRKVHLRYPRAIRPWQHVLDCLHGYLMVTQHLASVGVRDAGAWNVGPAEGGLVTVAQVAELLGSRWGVQDSWVPAGGVHPEEAAVLALDSGRARDELGWHNVLSVTTSVEWAADWHLRVARGEQPLAVTVSQIEAFIPHMNAFGGPRTM